ncbi:hypothetical protein SAMN05216285_1928 [Natrinema salifodinae]|uniref:ThiS family protein n=1 Tax=Natrinema salifodinae TaxID=1202768 RepID=A0A1I0NNJ4_9EURY|nr:hypothetical protein SAMN05216285_1928 [Natrinema salifodinae]
METDVTVYGPLRSATGAKTVTIEWPGGTVADAVAALVDAYPARRRTSPTGTRCGRASELRSTGSARRSTSRFPTARR